MPGKFDYTVKAVDLVSAVKLGLARKAKGMWVTRV